MHESYEMTMNAYTLEQENWFSKVGFERRDIYTIRHIQIVEQKYGHQDDITDLQFFIFTIFNNSYKCDVSFDSTIHLNQS